jgi:hypothetical protein
MSVSRRGIVVVLAVVIAGSAGLWLWPELEPLPPYPRARPDIQVWDADLPPPEGMR